MSKFTQLVQKPSAESINTGRSPLAQSAMLEHFGSPAAAKTKDCGKVGNGKLKAAIITENVGPFKVTGHKAAVKDLINIFGWIKEADPDLFKALGTAGMLCVRTVRGGSNWSNHSWGFAIDLTLSGVLDARGDNKVQAGLLTVYKFFHRAGWFWGSEFPTEDAMHFEMSLERFNELKAQGAL